MSNIHELVEGYLAAWNERDAQRRKEIIARTWSSDALYVDPHRSGEGHEGISKMIEEVQARFDSGYRFRLKGAIEAHNERMRFQWEAGGTKEAPLHFVGTDFGVVGSDGRLKSVTGFVDEAPQQ